MKNFPYNEWQRRFAAACIALSLVISPSLALAEELIVYTAIEAEDLERYKNTFNQAHPDIEIEFVRDSTGIITAKLLAEKENPRADVVWGLAATSLLVLANEGMLFPYAPKGLDKLNPKFVDKGNPPSWTGMDAWVASICYNTIEAKKHNLPKPTSWKDLLNPVYKGHLIMPNPASSGTGFLDVSSWLQLFGEKGGWEYMDGLHKNIARYTHSGSKPCKLAASGEIPIGISFAFRAAKSKNAGAPLDIVIPSEGIGWDLEASAIVKGTKKLASAKKLIDWSVTKEANRMYNKAYAVVAYPGVAEAVKNYPVGVTDKMIDNDFAWAAKNRRRILKEWSKRYDGKSDPKN